MKLSDYIDVEQLAKEIKDGYVDVKIHETLPLALLCHTKKATLDWHWNDVTTKCRGLICTIDQNFGDIIARPFEKFFDVNTPGRPETLVLAEAALPRPVVSDKLDGSLGIFWEYNGHWGVASKGSFSSEHAQWATNWLANHIEEHGALVWPKGYTPVFEMIAESVQTHVINYNGVEDLILIALVNNETGEELPPMALESYAKRNDLRVVTFYRMNLAGAMGLDREGHEGFVFTYPVPGKAPLKLKVKHPTFKVHQKWVYHLTPKRVLEALMNGDPIFDGLAGLLPQHVYNRVMEWSITYKTAYKAIQARCVSLCYEVLATTTTRKEAAAILTQPDNQPYAGICFALMDQHQSYKKLIWKLVSQRVHIENTVGIEEE